MFRETKAKKQGCSDLKMIIIRFSDFMQKVQNDQQFPYPPSPLTPCFIWVSTCTWNRSFQTKTRLQNSAQKQVLSINTEDQAELTTALIFS